MSLHDGEGFVLVAQIVDGHLVALEREYFHSAERAVGEDGLSVFQGEHRTGRWPSSKASGPCSLL